MELTIVILTFTVAGFALGCFNTTRTMWKSAGEATPRNITDSDAAAIVSQMDVHFKVLIQNELKKCNIQPIGDLLVNDD